MWLEEKNAEYQRREDEAIAVSQQKKTAQQQAA
jgi:hypothetical protein